MLPLVPARPALSAYWRATRDTLACDGSSEREGPRSTRWFVRFPGFETVSVFLHLLERSRCGAPNMSTRSGLTRCSSAKGKRPLHSTLGSEPPDVAPRASRRRRSARYGCQSLTPSGPVIRERSKQANPPASDLNRDANLNRLRGRDAEVVGGEFRVAVQRRKQHLTPKRHARALLRRDDGLPSHKVGDLLWINAGQKALCDGEPNGGGHVGFFHKPDVHDQTLDPVSNRNELEMLPLTGVWLVGDDHRDQDQPLVQHTVVLEVV